MKRLLLFLTLCFPVLLFSQQSVLSAGGDGIGIGGTSSFSLGQVSYSSFNAIGLGTINEGVQQYFAELDPLTISLSKTDVSCNGGSDGTLTVHISGGIPPYTIKWFGFPETTETLSGLPAISTKYRVKVTDSMGGKKNERMKILEPDALTISFDNVTNADCQGNETGSATVSAAGGTGPYTYFWSNGETTETVSNLHAGAYMVTATDYNECTSVSAVTITDPNGLDVSVHDLSNVSCNGGNDGSVSLIVNPASGTSPYDLRGYYKNGVWSGNLNLPFTPAFGVDHGIEVDDLEEGQYSFYIQDANGCQISISTTVDEPTLLISDIITSTDVSCYGDSDGTATVYATGGTTPYTYAWTGGATSATATGLAAGTYTVTITDANGCEVENSTTIEEPSYLFITTIGGNDVSCYGGSDGNIYTQIWGGTAPYTYIWFGFSAADNTQDALNIPAGYYTLIVIDANGCTAIKPFIQVTEPSMLTVNIDNVTNADCAGNETGSATAYGSGGTGDITYAWSNGDDEATAYGMHAGGYSVTATDENGCTAQASTTITDPNGMSLEVTESSQPWCKGDDNGSVTLGILNTGNLGGTPPYTLVDIYFNGNEISVDMPFTGNTLYVDGLDAGQYVFVVRDDNNCEVAQDFTMDEPTLLIADVTTSTDVSCFGGSDGTGTVYATGGTTPYGYEWSNGQTTVTATGLAAGTHSVTVTDANGCQESEEIEIGEPVELSLTLNSTEDVSCYGGSDGYIYIGTTGGTAPYNYTWTGSTPQPIDNAQDAQNISAGTYSVEVTDANGCTFEIEDIVITEPTELTVTIGNVMDADCAGNETGSATATGAGGTGTITYTWSNGDATATASALHAGGYSVTATDANGCTAQASVSITDPTGMSMEVLLSNQPSCNGGDDGSVTLGILNTGNLGGTPPYTLVKIIRDLNATVVSTPFVMESLTINDLVAGQYSFIVVDANGCEVVEEHTLDEPTLLIAEIISSTGETCLNAADGTATVNATGGTTPYTYLWSDGQTVYDATGFVAGTYTVTVTDANGCVAITSVVIGDPDTTDPVIESFVDLTFDCSSISSTTDPSALLAQWLENNYLASDDRELVGVSYDYTAITLDLCTASTTVVTWTAIDACGNTATATSNLIIDPDVTAPTLTVPSAPLAIDCTSISSTSSPAALVAAWLAEASISDDCDNAPTLTHNFDNGALDVCAAADYSITVTWTATDACGNEESASQTIDVTVDVTAPTLTVPSAPLAIDCTSISSTSSPAAMVDAWMAEAGATDGCDNAPSLVHSFDMSQLDVCAAADYSITVTWTATDACGNEVSASQTIDVTVDVTAPTITAPADVTFDADVNCNFVLSDYTSTIAGDDCDSDVQVSQSPLPGTVLPLGLTVVTLTATDNCGNESDDTFNVVVEDNTNPVAICQDITVQLDASGNATIVAADVDNSSFDNCSVASLSIDVSTFTCADLGSDNQVVLTVTDGSGNTATCIANVIVEDNVAPTFTCPAALDVQGCDGLVPDLISTIGDEMDNCGIVTLTQSPLPGVSIGNNGNSVDVVVTATDASGNTSSCTVTVTVVDDTAPVFQNCPTAISVANDPDQCGAIVSWIAPVALDNCIVMGPGSVVLTAGMPSGSVFPVGTSTVTYTATDDDGNTTTCTFNVTVSDTESPEFITTLPADEIVECDAIPDPFVVIPMMHTVDNCTEGADIIVDYGEEIIDIVCDHTYTIVRTWTITDEYGNSAVHKQKVYVQDTTAPTFTVPADVTIECDESTDPSNTGDVTDEMDNCDSAPVVAYTDIEDLTGCGGYTGTITRTWTVTDACGNVTTKVQVITIEDTTGPDAVCQNITVELDDNGEVVISANDVNNGSTDNCAAQSALTLAISKSSFTCADIGANLVTLTVTDPCGNIGTCVATVTVEDNIAPVIACPDDMIIHLDPGACEQVLSYDILATDNCAVTVEQIAGSFGSGDGFPIGGPYVLTYEATDEGGNTAQCSFSVTVFEYVPTSNDMTCNSLVNISLDENCEAIISADQILEGNNYGCYDDYIITSEDANGNVVPGNVLDITHVGMTITVTITDPVTGVSCWGTVYVEDKLVPEFDCPADVTIACSENATPSLTGEPVITSCELSHTVTSVDIFTDFGQCADPRAQIERTWTVTDDSGNSATCVQLITIAAVDLADVIFPADLVDANALECSDVSNNPSLTESGNAGFPTINGLEITNSGLCMASINVSDEVYDICEGSYEILRTWKVRNMCLPIGPGNPVEHIQIIKVLDTEGPVVEAPADITISTSGTSCETGFTAPAANITDGCSTFSVVTDTPFGSLVSNGGSLSQALDLGTHTITYIATDGCGNVGFDVMTITVEDQIAPIAICDENTTVSLDNNGFGSIAAITFDDGSYDNCSDVTFEVRKVFNSCDPTNNAFGSSVSFCCEEVGTEVMVELRVTDAAGNFNACMVLVDVQDKIDPTVICPTDADVDCSETYLDYIEVGQALPQDAVDANGEAVAIDNCTVASLTSNVIGNTVDCGSGTITIVWTATDGGGRTSSCIQRYFVTNSDIFSESDITWPLDYTANTCGTGLEPSDLSSPYNYPTVDEGACNNVAVGHDDQVLGFGVGDACLKILRKWYVVDWCQAGANQNPTQPGPGVWHYTQIIKVINSNDPTVTVVNFPSVVDNYDADCGNVFVAFDITADDDCTAPADLQVSWEFSTGLSGTGLSASGSFANGSYSLTYTVSDGCSNTVWEIHDFTVVDAKQPTPVCIFGIATTVMPSSGAVTIHASDFESGSSYDNCTAYDDLAFSFSQDVNNVNITIACADIPANGLYPITLYVTDEAGNSDFCSTFINVQDPNGVCVTPTGLITGTIENEFQEVIEEVTVTLSDDNGIMNVPVVTGPTGIFQFNQTYGDYDVTPEKDINHLNGVTTYDLVLISKHILGIELFDSPYKMIAADANNSGAITALDLVKIRSVILYLDDEFTNNTSWRFVEQDYVFPDPTNPWTEEFPEFIGLTTTIDPANFTAIKVGDVNGSASPNSLLGSDTRTFSGNLALQLEATKVAEGETFTVDFRAKDFKQIAGYQFTLEFDNAAVDFVDVRTNLEGLGSENFGLTKIEEGVITTSWNSSKGINVADDKVLFSMTFLANTTANTAEVFTINSRYTESEAYNGTELFNVVLEFNGNEVESVFELYQNIPNPFKEETNISFNLPQAGAVTLRIMDVAGRTLKLINMDAAKGMNSVSLTRDEFNATGVLYYQLESADNTATMKMIIVD